MGVAYGFVEHLNELKNNIGLYYCVVSVEKLVGFNATRLRVFGKLYGRISHVARECIEILTYHY
jgi:hypothetical protein